MATSQPVHSVSPVEVILRLDRTLIQAGQEVWAEFSVINLTGDPLALRVPQTTSDESPTTMMGLPIGHVFSGTDFSALSIVDSNKDSFDTQVHFKPRRPVPTVQLRPYGSAGVRIELTKHYDSLKRPGKYTLVWQPYENAVQSPPVQVTIMAERQAVILTEFGKMTLRFYYNEAPRHVENFIELAGQKFYDGLTINRIVSGGVIQGGDPRGDRRGIRPDGKRLAAEFNKIQFETGTAGMARSSKDPDSASCQFFICLARQPSFDGKQTAFAYLVGDESFETLRRIADVPCGPDDRPREPVYIRAISLENVPLRNPDHAIGIQSANPGSAETMIKRLETTGQDLQGGVGKPEGGGPPHTVSPGTEGSGPAPVSSHPAGASGG